MISIDDLNDWIGVFGENPNAKTPNIDRLAGEGFLFTNAHCQAPICGPSRASLLSGLRPSTTGIYGQIRDENLRKAHPILNQISFLPEYFANNGYKTLGVGKIFHGHAPKGVFQVSGGRIRGFGPKPKESFKWFSINIKIFLPLFEKNKYIFLLFGLIIIPDELNSTYLS